MMPVQGRDETLSSCTRTVAFRLHSLIASISPYSRLPEAMFGVRTALHGGNVRSFPKCNQQEY